MEQKKIASRFTSLNRTPYVFFTSRYADTADIKLRGKFILFNTITLVGVAILIPFGIFRLVQGPVALGCIDLLAAAFLASLSIYHWIVKHNIIPRIIGVALINILFGYLAISTGYHNTGILWSYCLPAIMIFILDRKRGSLFLSAYLLLLTICFSVPVFPSHYNYSADIKTSFLFSFIAVWVIAYYFEYIMSSLHNEVIQNNSQLNRTITELKETKDQLFQAQKMEAIGRLAGGVAHDFNNIIAVIRGYADIIKVKYADDEKLGHYTTSIIDSTTRAADLTAKLLAYARKGKIEMMAFDMHEIIEDVIDICKHTLDRKIVISQKLAAQRVIIMGDRNQIQNALINLAVNARDAMPDGGKLTFTTENLDLSESAIVHTSYKVIPGSYLKFCLSDTGTGMDAATLARAFEPFFTTKRKSKGTGLGLSSIYGTIKSHTGYIELKSEIGKGTRAEIYLPLTRNVELIKSDKPGKLSSGQGTILFVDDEEMIREMASEMIKMLGYSVVTSKDGRDALDYYQTHAREIDLVVLDLIMPRLGGYDCFEAMKTINPKLKAIASSGYVINDEVNKMLDHGALGFIHKPFSITDIAKAIKAALHDQRYLK